MHPSFYNFSRYDIVDKSNDKVTSFGNENGKLLVVVTNEYVEIMYKTLLDNILNAIHSTEENTYIIIINERYKLSTLPHFDSYLSVICLGIKPLYIGLNLEHSYFQTKAVGDRRYLFGPKLSDINGTMEYKKALWTVLKKEYILDQ
ncbi:MAG: hypothetical protein V3V00_10525 [Saprospiraceae bacterium]